MRRRLLALAVAAPLLLAMVATQAHAGAITETERVKNETETFVDSLPCLGGKAQITITYNAVFHFTKTRNGTHFTGTIAGTFVADPLTAGLPTYRGHFSQWFGDNQNESTRNGCFTFNIIGKADDGSTIKFHENAHFTRTRNGVVVGFDKLRCH
jgi:hypothetical protein